MRRVQGGETEAMGGATGGGRSAQSLRLCSTAPLPPSCRLSRLASWGCRFQSCGPCWCLWTVLAEPQSQVRAALWTAGGCGSSGARRAHL